MKAIGPLPDTFCTTQEHWSLGGLGSSWVENEDAPLCSVGLVVSDAIPILTADQARGRAQSGLAMTLNEISGDGCN
jgi:hypothetical protein